MRCNDFEKRVQGARGARSRMRERRRPGRAQGLAPDRPRVKAGQHPPLPEGGGALRDGEAPRDFGTDSGFRAARGPRGERVQGLRHEKAAIGDRSLKLANLGEKLPPVGD